MGIILAAMYIMLYILYIFTHVQLDNILPGVVDGGGGGGGGGCVAKKNNKALTL